MIDNISNVDFALEQLFFVEHRNNPKKMLHFNKKEKTYTFAGVYPYTKLQLSCKIDRALSIYEGNIEEASGYLSEDTELKEEVRMWYIENFIEPLSLDKITSKYKMAEMLVFYANIGQSKERVKITTKWVQKIVGAKVDGIIGKETISKINLFDDKKFDKLFDQFEEWFYRNWLYKRYPTIGWAIEGLVNRAFLV